MDTSCRQCGGKGREMLEMRVNIEDEDFGSYKLRMAAGMFDEEKLVVPTENAVMGLVSKMWYHAVNELKREITVKDLSRYLLIFNKELITKILVIFVECEYLAKVDDDLYQVIGKEKDYLIKEGGKQSTAKARQAKKEKISDDGTADSSVHSSVDSTVHRAADRSVDRSVDSVADNSADRIPFIHSLHSEHSLQITQSNSTQSPSAPLAPAARSSSEEFREVEDFYKDLQSKLNLPEDGTPLPVIEPAPCVASEVKGISWIKPGETTPTKVDKSNYQSFVHDYYQALWKKRMKSDKWPGFSGRDFALCKEIMKQLTFDIERFCRLMDLYFSWQLPEVIEAGFPFSKGYASFHHKLTELMADEANPARRAEAVIAKGNMKLNEAKVRDEERARRILGGKKDGDGPAPALPA